MVQVNGETGKAEKIMKGGERIFSRKHTKDIVQMATSCKTSADRINLGKYVAAAIRKQDMQQPEYTEE